MARRLPEGYSITSRVAEWGDTVYMLRQGSPVVEVVNVLPWQSHRAALRRLRRIAIQRSRFGVTG